MDLLKVVRQAVGLAEPRPEDLVREDELAIVPAIELQLSTGLQPITEGTLKSWVAAIDTEPGDAFYGYNGEPVAARSSGSSTSTALV
jgi:hypothetical protein